jgi:DNA-binding transcriptional LysR family regulator
MPLDLSGGRAPYVDRAGWDVPSCRGDLKLLARGGLYSLASSSAIAAEVAAKELALVRIVSPEIRQTFYLVVAARRHASPAVQAIASIVRGLAGKRGGLRRPPHAKEAP